MPPIPAPSLARNGDVLDPPTSREAATVLLRECCEAAILDVTAAAEDPSCTFMSFERGVREHVFAIGRALVVLFLVVAEARVSALTPSSLKCGGRRFRRAPPQTRNLNTMFGVVRYTRVYLRQVGAGSKKKRLRGFHPVDAELGLCSDRITMNVLSVSARMATKMSYAEAKSTVGLMVPTAPSTEVIEQTVLGMGHLTERWFEQKPAPEGDGDVLVIQFDAKGAPMAGEDELARRRGPHPRAEKAPSPRHRGRAHRRRHPKRPRRKMGDVSKNARMANMVVMYTLRRKGDLMLGPINRVLYASFAPKENAFHVARREADKRGFHDGSGKLVQIITDGDNDLHRYINQYFPRATQTIDFAHCIEKIWAAGQAIFAEGTPAHRQWVEAQRRRLRAGEARQTLRELRRHLASTPKTGPGNKYRRQKLRETVEYVEKRLERMNYGSLIERDLELSTGQIEGAIKNVIGKRCDHGGMRWIKARAEAVLQLRCIEVNGDWDAFIDYIHDVHRAQSQAMGIRARLQTDAPRPLPEKSNTERYRRRRRQVARRRDQYLSAAA